jgi:hypothetical protein
MWLYEFPACTMSRLVWLSFLPVRSERWICLTHLQMKTTPKCSPYTVSAVEFVGLLGWYTSNDIHFAEFHIAKHFRTYTETFFEGNSYFPTSNAESEQHWRRGGDVLTAVQRRPSTSTRRISTTTGVAHVNVYPRILQRIQSHAKHVRSCERLQPRYMSCGWGPVFLRCCCCCYQHKEFALLDARKSTLGYPNVIFHADFQLVCSLEYRHTSEIL